MKYEEIKVNESYYIDGEEHKVIHKQDESKAVFTLEVGSDDAYGWNTYQLKMFKPIKEELPEEGLLVSGGGSLVYKLSDGSGYGFVYGNQSDYYFNKLWSFKSNPSQWKQATQDQEKQFIEMLKKECEKRGLFEDTKIEAHADGSPLPGPVWRFFKPDFLTMGYNKNGQIFHKGKFAKPLKESTLDQVTDAVKDIADFTIEESPTGLIILTPIK